jgi:Na+-driven multidrug efflux pump
MEKAKKYYYYKLMDDYSNKLKSVNLWLRAAAGISLLLSVLIPLLGMMLSLACSGISIAFYIGNKENDNFSNDIVRTMVFSIIVFLLSTFIMVANAILSNK